ncbi:hypothetical protein HK102_003828, partial [Quaeritorhiza haematococci]
KKRRDRGQVPEEIQAAAIASGVRVSEDAVKTGDVCLSAQTAGSILAAATSLIVSQQRHIGSIERMYEAERKTRRELEDSKALQGQKLYDQSKQIEDLGRQIVRVQFDQELEDESTTTAVLELALDHARGSISKIALENVQLQARVDQLQKELSAVRLSHSHEDLTALCEEQSNEIERRQVKEKQLVESMAEKTWRSMS